MAHKNQSPSLTVTPEILNSLSVARGLTLTESQLKAITQGQLSAPPVPFCVSAIGYEGTTGNILLVQFSVGTFLSSADVDNLNDFKEQFQDALNFKHAVSFLLDSGNRIEFLQVIGCHGCECKSEGVTGISFGEPATPVVP